MIVRAVLNAKILLNYLSECNVNYYPDRATPLKSKSQREHIISVISNCSNAIKQNNICKTTLRTGLLTRVWHLEIVWFLSSCKLLEICDYFKTHGGSKEIAKNIAEDLTQLYFAGPESLFKLEMRTEMLRVISTFCDDQENTESNIMTLFTELSYERLKAVQVDVGNNSTPLIDDTLRLPKNASIFELLTNIASCSFNDGGNSAREALGKIDLYKPNQSTVMQNLYNGIINYVDDLADPVSFLSDYLLSGEEESKVNWCNIALFIYTIIQKSSYAIIKPIIHDLIEYSLEHSSSWHLYAAFVIGKICSVGSTVNLSYLQWFSSTFSCDSHRPLNTNEKARFFLKCMSDVVYEDQPGHLKVHIHKVASVPSACQAELSDYVQMAKTCLRSMNESIELGFFENVDGARTVENDIKCLLAQYDKNNKIPHSFLASLNFRRQYFEREFLPKLLSCCKGKSTSHHALIKQLATLGKISNGAYANHVQMCGRDGIKSA